jgi:hypothetical protein
LKCLIHGLKELRERIDVLGTWLFQFLIEDGLALGDQHPKLKARAFARAS